MAGTTITRRWLLGGLVACLSASGCAWWRAMTEPNTPDEIIQREAAQDQINLINTLQQGFRGDPRAGRIE